MGRLLYLVVVVIAILVILDIIKSNKDNEKKILWVVIVFFLPVLGAILWYVVGKKQ